MTYSATLTESGLVWGPQGGPPLSAGQAVEVQVVTLPVESEDDKDRRFREAMDALESIAARGGPTTDFGDPVEWQRAMRKDKPLFGREE